MTGHNNRCATPFGFPFAAPLAGIGLFDTDPTRILNMIHHQSMLAEEALRYRGIFLTKDSMRFNPLNEMFAKEQDNILKRSSLHFGMNPLELLTPSKDIFLKDVLRANIDAVGKIDEAMKKRNENLLKDGLQKYNMDFFLNKERNSPNPKELLDEILFKRSSSYFKDGLRFNPMTSGAINDLTTHLNKEKGSSSTTTTTSSTSTMISNKYNPETFFHDNNTTTTSINVDDDTRCNLCNASFPNVWLLEQHGALQHPTLGTSDEKPFICDQCGQSYRYRSAYAKHREHNHRARLPADKLFTCDVCGMQFRYLKSFKKHRLNHALERLHGKNEKKSAENNCNNNNSDMVTSTNESLVSGEENVNLKGIIKDEEDEEEQDNTIDSAGIEHSQQVNEDGQAKITSSQMEYNALKTNIASTSATLQNNFNFKQMNQHPLMGLQRLEAETSMTAPTINSLLLADRVPNEQALGLNPQEASLLNFLRADAAERQRERRFACPFCGKCVRSKENLKLHVRKHTGERPFVCLFCGRAFGGKSDLTRHLRIHTGERPYHCEACGKCFARADYLSKHLTTHIHNTPR